MKTTEQVVVSAVTDRVVDHEVVVTTYTYARYLAVIAQYEFQADKTLVQCSFQLSSFLSVCFC